MYRIVASDMDETFLGHNKKPTQSNLDAVAAMGELGVRFVVATGRPYFSVQGTLEEVGTKGDPDSYTITLNGGYVCANDGTVVAAHPLDARVAERLRAFGQDKGLCGHMYLEDRTLAMNLNDGEREFLHSRMEVVPSTWEEAASLDEPVYKVLFEDTDLDALHRLLDEATEALGELSDTVEPVYSSDRYVEFNPAGVGKGSGLAEIARTLGVPLDETVAIGDSVNDLSMLEAAGLPLVVSNVSELARPLLPENCRILASSCNDGCMPEVLEDYIKPSMER
ncbi:HAD family hydrolase [Atopobiaceae bacterium 24-176]